MKIINDIGSDGCPCGEYKDKNVHIHAHCWRSHGCCPFSGLHYKIIGDKKLGMEKVKEIKKDIEDGYGTEVRITKTAMK